MKLIDKDAVVAEINKRIMDAPIDCYGHQRVWAYNDVKDILDTLEVKEVDFDALVDEAFDKYSSVDGYGQLAVSFNRAELYSFIKKIARKEE